MYWVYYSQAYPIIIDQIATWRSSQSTKHYLVSIKRKMQPKCQHLLAFAFLWSTYVACWLSQKIDRLPVSL